MTLPDLLLCVQYVAVAIAVGHVALTVTRSRQKTTAQAKAGKIGSLASSRQAVRLTTAAHHAVMAEAPTT